MVDIVYIFQKPVDDITNDDVLCWRCWANAHSFYCSVNNTVVKLDISLNGIC